MYQILIPKDFVPSEVVAIYEAMEEHKRGRKGKEEIVSESDTNKPKLRERASKSLGLSTDTLSKATQVVKRQTLPN